MDFEIHLREIGFKIEDMALSTSDIIKFIVLFALSGVLYFYSIPAYAYWLFAGACLSVVLKVIAIKLKQSRSKNG